jgi:hypothetical protein
MKEFVLKEMNQYSVKVKTNKCAKPVGLNHIEFVQETKNDKGEVVDTSTYQFFLTESEIKTLVANLVD